MRLHFAFWILLISCGVYAEDWSDEVLYFVITDRFVDGDLSNNLNLQRDNPGGFHGGDFKGLTQQLDEIVDLGATALWITPVQQQIKKPTYAGAAGSDSFQHWGFHGYWIDDFEKIEPRLGSEAELKQLVDAAHQRGLKVLLDVIYNHAGYGSKYTRMKASDGRFYTRLGEGDCASDPVKCRVGGLPDFRTELPEIREYLLKQNIALAKRTGIDGFRLDTFKHIEDDFWSQHRDLTHKELGDDFFLLAEQWGANYKSLDPFFANDRIDAGFDFSFKGNCESFVNGRGRAIAFAAYLKKRHKIRDGYLAAHYLSTHDEPMALASMDSDINKFKICVAVQMTSKGLPVIYYGEEVARKGNHWPTNRKDMPWGNRDIQPGKGDDRNESLRNYYKQLIAIRKKHPALYKGDYSLLSGRQDPLLAYALKDSASGDAVVVLVNRDKTEQQGNYSLSKILPASSTLKDELTGEEIELNSEQLQVSIAPQSVQILVVKQD